MSKTNWAPWLRKKWRSVRKEWRFQTASQRRLPDFVIIGTQKGGTTSLYHYLKQHPQFEEPFRKEIHFFDKYYDRGLDWYRAFFPRKSSVPGALTGEATPYYLYHPLAPARVARDLPEVKLIVLLRDPVERAYSHYHFLQRRGRIRAKTFRKAIQMEEAQLEDEKRRLLADPEYVSVFLQRYSFLDRGHYARQLRRWFQYVPREQFLILKSEDLFSNPEATLDRVARSLGMDPFPPFKAKVKNAGSYPELNEELLEELRARYQPEMDELAELIGQEFSWWQESLKT